jgi:hypothetical protein
MAGKYNLQVVSLPFTASQLISNLKNASSVYLSFAKAFNDGDANSANAIMVKHQQELLSVCFATSFFFFLLLSLSFSFCPCVDILDLFCFFGGNQQFFRLITWVWSSSAFALSIAGTFASSRRRM